MWCCLATLLPACGSPPVSSSQLPPIPANLDLACDSGPPIPRGDVTAAQALEVWAQREAAAAECRSRVQGLRAAWPR